MSSAEMIVKIADYIVNTGRRETFGDRWAFCWDDLDKEFDLPDGWLAAFAKELLYQIFEHKAVSDADVALDSKNNTFCFNVIFYPQFCLNLKNWRL